MDTKIKLLKREVLEGEKVYLEPFSLKRDQAFYELYQASKHKWDASITVVLDSLENTRDYILEQEKLGVSAYFIIEKASDKLAGFILGDKLFGQPLIARTRVICPVFERKGYACEAAILFNSWAKQAGFIGVVAFIFPLNSRAIELVVREGFEKHDIPVQSPSGHPLLVYAKEL